MSTHHAHAAPALHRSTSVAVGQREERASETLHENIRGWDTIRSTPTVDCEPAE